MRKYFEISGYWKDTDENFEGYIVTNFDDHEEDSQYSEDEIFYYGLDTHNLDQMIQDSWDTMEDFIVTEYKELSHV